MKKEYSIVSTFNNQSLGTVNKSTIFVKTLADGESGTSETQDFPLNFPILGSIGKVPNRGTLTNSDKDSPPPLLNMFVHSVQVGHTNLQQK